MRAAVPVDPDAHELKTQLLGEARAPLSVQHAWGRAFQGAGSRAHTVLRGTVGLRDWLGRECVERVRARAEENQGGREREKMTG